MKKTVLREYAKLIVRCGMNVQKGQEVNIIAGLDHTCINEVGDLSAALSGEISEFENACALQKLYKFSLIAFHIISPFSCFFRSFLKERTKELSNYGYYYFSSLCADGSFC